jgi:hypothetical protein
MIKACTALDRNMVCLTRKVANEIKNKSGLANDRGRPEKKYGGNSITGQIGGCINRIGCINCIHL